MKARQVDSWRDEFVSPGEFKCACGCALQLSKGDLADAIRVASRFDGRPRTAGVTYTTFPQARETRRDEPEPMESEPCPKCRTPVEVPAFAAKVLRDRGGAWPICDDCRQPKQLELHHASQYWE